MGNQEEIINLESELVKAQLTSNIELLDRLLDDNLMFRTIEGNIIGKSDDLNLHKSGSFRITKMELIDRIIQDLGGVVVVYSKMNAEAYFNDIVNSGILCYTRVWEKQDNTFKLIAGHMSAVQF